MLDRSALRTSGFRGVADEQVPRRWRQTSLVPPFRKHLEGPAPAGPRCRIFIAEMLESERCLLVKYIVPLPKRTRPSHHPVVTTANRPLIIFVTVCSKGKAKLFANADFVDHVCEAWNEADDWLVGRWIVMPDHIHLFCSPKRMDSLPLRTWVKYWKSLVSKSVGRRNGKSIWLRDCWDTQLRSGDSYSEKWEYVKRNPVRAGLVVRTEDWPWQGEANVLFWQ